MNWIIYVAVNVFRLLIIGGMVLLSVAAVPVILLLVLLGMSLSHLRDVEPQLYTYKFPSIVFTNLKTASFYLYPQIISRFQHVLVSRNKPNK